MYPRQIDPGGQAETQPDRPIPPAVLVCTWEGGRIVILGRELEKGGVGRF